MIYADTDFFLALLKENDWLQTSAKKLLAKHKGSIWTSPVTLIELMLLAVKCDLDPSLIDLQKYYRFRYHSRPIHPTQH